MHHTIEIPEEGAFLYMPSTLAECTHVEYIEMCGLLYRYLAGELSYMDVRVQAVYKLLNLKQSKRTLMVVDEEAKWGNIYILSQLIDTFFEDANGQKVMKLDYVHNPVPKFKPLWRTYHGTTPGFLNVTFGEYLDGLRLFLEFSKSGNTNLLYMLAAVFYRKAKPLHWFRKSRTDYDGDIREAYNEHTVEARAKALKYAPMGFVYGFYLTFASFQKYITSAVVPWGGRELDLSILFEGDSGEMREAVPGRGMDGIAGALAESGQLGDLDKVRGAKLWEVFLLLYDLKKKDLDYKLNEKSSK